MKQADRRKKAMFNITGVPRKSHLHSPKLTVRHFVCVLLSLVFFICTL